MKFFVNKFTPFLLVPEGRAKHFDLNPGAIVEVEEPDHPLVAATYVTNEGVEKFGFLNREHIEPYIENFPKNSVKIEFQTSNPNDLEQYHLWDGHKIYNACGEICVAHILGVDYKEIIENWTQKSPSVWKRIRGKGSWSGTGPDDLIDLFKVFGQEAVSLSKVLKRYTMSGMQKLMDSGDIITSCKIDTQTGRLRGSGALHWVHPVKLFPERQYGLVQLMNPAPLREEQYSWQEFLNSSVVPYGVYVPGEFRTAAKPLEVE